jgi:hypothetical protein
MKHAAALAASLAALTVSAGAVVAQTPSPPSGVMTLYAGNAHGANFLIDDTVVRNGARVSFSNFRVFPEPVEAPNGPVVMDVEAVVLDCDARRITIESIDAFKVSGEHAFHLPAEPTEAIEPNDNWDFAAQVLCDGVELPPTQKRTGWQAAREVALFMIARAS